MINIFMQQQHLEFANLSTHFLYKVDGPSCVRILYAYAKNKKDLKNHNRRSLEIVEEASHYYMRAVQGLWSVVYLYNPKYNSRMDTDKLEFVNFQTIG